MEEGPFYFSAVGDVVKIKLKKPMVGAVQGKLAYIAIDESYVEIVTSDGRTLEIAKESVEVLLTRPADVVSSKHNDK